jgi:hypothetical protein
MKGIGLAGGLSARLQNRQGLLAGCPKELACSRGFIIAEDLRHPAASFGKPTYRHYLERLVQEPDRGSADQQR